MWPVITAPTISRSSVRLNLCVLGTWSVDNSPSLSKATISVREPGPEDILSPFVSVLVSEEEWFRRWNQGFHSILYHTVSFFITRNFLLFKHLNKLNRAQLGESLQYCNTLQNRLRFDTVGFKSLQFILAIHASTDAVFSEISFEEYVWIDNVQPER